MKLKIFLFGVAAAAASLASAAPVSPDVALRRAIEDSPRLFPGNSCLAQYKSSIAGPDGKAALYVFTYSGNDGFLLLPADDAVRPIVGYSVSNKFDMNDIPVQLDAWIDNYSAQIVASRDMGPYRKAATRADEKPEIKPMLTTQWSQSLPYFNQCPMIKNWRAVTGCVATAMAQVMKYWNYPRFGQGSITYTSTNVAQPLSMDFSETEFDWANMLDVYKAGEYTPEEALAVSTLMKACGYSVQMEYGTSESSAMADDIGLALQKYFGYDSGVKCVYRDTYGSQASWNQLIYNNLTNVGPVLYTGQSKDGGHAFVCDGYDGNGYFHINWGWGGLSDGYFLLEELTPSEVGTGGHYGGYNMSQRAFVGIIPPVGRVELNEIQIDNAAPDSGIVSGKGYIYRINDFSNIKLSVSLDISGGHVNSPLYVRVYETNPSTLKNERLVVDTTFKDKLDASDGNVSYSTTVKIPDYDLSKFYTLTILYDLKGETVAIGNVRMAVSSGIDGITDDGADLVLNREGDVLKASACGEVSLCLYSLDGTLVESIVSNNPTISLNSLAPGLYMAKASDQAGNVRTLKLLLR